MEAKKSKYANFAIVILFILYAVGIAGISTDMKASFLSLTPLNLLISVLVALYFHEDRNKCFFLFIGFTFLVGYLIEVIGVNTGYPFGKYSYGEVLGFKMFETPLMIGVNWLLLVYATASTINSFLGKSSLFLKAAIGAGIMLLLDFLIEPVAIKLGFWDWETVNIPIQNYISWFFIAFCMHLYCFKKIGEQSNKVAIVLLFLQFLFFGILNFSI